MDTDSLEHWCITELVGRIDHNPIGTRRSMCGLYFYTELRCYVCT